MKSDVSPGDWKELCAYIDQQLNPKAQRRLEMRLQVEPQLRYALNDLVRTKALLRSQPRLFAPRNFTLTPSMAGISRANTAYPVVRLAAVLASLMLVMVMAGDLLTNGPVRVAYQEVFAPLAGSQPVLTVAVEMDVPREEESFEQPAAKALPPSEIPPLAAPAEVVLQPTPTSEAALMDEMPSMVAEAPDTIASETPAPTDTPPATFMVTTMSVQGGEPAEDQAIGEAPKTAQQINTAQAPQTAPVFSVYNLAILGIELLLALLAVVGWLAVIYFGQTG